jgi:hypothetical protein
MPAFILAWLVNPAHWLKLAAGAGLAALLVFAAAQTIRLQHAKADLAKAQVKVQVEADQNAVASGQAAAVQAAASVADQGAQHAAIDITLHQDNQHAIQAASGAAAPLAPALNAAGRLGLCRYDAYASDPACAGLRVDHPAQLPQAGGGDAPAAR